MDFTAFRSSRSTRAGKQDPLKEADVWDVQSVSSLEASFLGRLRPAQEVLNHVEVAPSNSAARA